ncbi:hypothetical protein KSP40_PGU006909 [Platanthera guangdongensis]|uniref:Uncharacterized protein n=1 Tax=Platanthera guangdongensis TaxID=2320717 RepID=A0ABR2LPU7_9ASPA
MQSKLFKHGRSSLVVLIRKGRLCFYISPIIFCRTACAMEWDLWVNFGRCFHQHLKMLLKIVMIMERLWYPDWPPLLKAAQPGPIPFLSAWSKARPGARLGLERGSAWSEARPGARLGMEQGSG